MSSTCAACAGESFTLLELPGLPLTGMFVDCAESVRREAGHDLHWQFCAACGHGQLARPLPPQLLYGEQYRFRTGASQTARKGAVVFRDWLLSVFPGRHFKTLVEFGCNDASLLELFAGHAERRIGIDPVLAHLDAAVNGVQLIPALIEEVTLAHLGDGGPDLVICQHTLEHILHPEQLIETLLRQTRPGTVFAFELPCLDLLLEQGRFDQIFHEHVQYFSLRSLSCLFARLGLEVIDFRFNVPHWGALLVAFRVGDGGDRGLGETFPAIDAARIEAGWRAFRQQADAFRELLRSSRPGLRVGYGAALMLPVLDHHFDLVGAGLAQVVDDDPARQGLWYRNLPIEVIAAETVDLAAATVVLTAPDNRRAILRRLAELAPYRIVSPLLAM